MAGEVTVDKVCLLIVDASDAGNLVLDTETLAHELSTGRSGYEFSIRETQIK